MILLRGWAKETTVAHSVSPQALHRIKALQLSELSICQSLATFPHIAFTALTIATTTTSISRTDRSGIYYGDEVEQRMAEAAKASFGTKLSRPITTEIIPAGPFYYAEDYHQQYLAKPGARPYCSAQVRSSALDRANFTLPSHC